MADSSASDVLYARYVAHTKATDPSRSERSWIRQMSVTRTSFRRWCEKPSDTGMRENTRKIIEDAVRKLLGDSTDKDDENGTTSNGSSGSSTGARADVDTGTEKRARIGKQEIKAVATNVVLEQPRANTHRQVAVPDEGWANEEWRFALRILDRESAIYNMIKEQGKDWAPKHNMAYVYIMRDPYREGVKIGLAGNPHKRKNDGHAFVPDLKLVNTFFCKDAYRAEQLAQAVGHLIETERLHLSSKEWVRLTAREATTLVLLAIQETEDRIAAMATPSA